MPAPVVVRAAREADLEALIGLLGILFSIEADFRPDRERQWRGLARMLADRAARTVCVAERAGAVIGMVTGQVVVSTAEGAPSVWVEDLVVVEGERGRGVGRRLLEAVAAWGLERGATRLQLLADRENGPALAFYERLGWRPTRLVCLRRGGAG
ncbi:MAG TPA: GNAT family N-acetyltransferase [Anaeromyxobacter sp.]|nr:GNAT family N-acetyltransferase [Anaeromyxobacter sp.]